jgi:uncharacterized membrane protein YphA (DoxX/SURF4 family)
MKTKNALLLIIRLIVAFILLQTLFFKFTAAPESVYIFSTLGMEPWGRIGSGIAELIISILLLVPSTVYIGALGGIFVISGAIMAHLTKLGIVVQDDDGLLFVFALVALAGCITLVVAHKDKYTTIWRKLRN